jgi:[acyl-carrier-protein] S-malonyltransferase
MKTAFVFPGQGSQKAGMGRDFFDRFDVARNLLEETNELVSDHFTNILFEGPASELTRTINAQPAILAVSISVLRVFESMSNLRPDFVAGHSLGEFSALVAAGALTFQDAIRLTRVRGQYMQEAVPEGHGAMAAVLRLDESIIADACNEAATHGIVSAANFNSPGQIVISGEKSAVEHAAAILSHKGGRVIPLKVSAPFHCELMAPAAERLAEQIHRISFSPPQIPVVTNVEATPNTDAQKIPNLLFRQVTGAVRWTESIRYMLNAGVSRFIEFGPGNVLSGLISKIEPSAEAISISTVEGLDKALQLLANSQSSDQ